MNRTDDKENGDGNGKVNEAETKPGAVIGEGDGNEKKPGSVIGKVFSNSPSSGSTGRVRGKGLLQRLNDGLYEFYVAPYRRSFARAQRDEEDLFMLLVFAESLGVPNPAAYYTMELLPVVYERFHEWHKRMGMEKSPLDHVHCC